ncbi:cytosolic carboxypeptidase 1-like [Rhopalosiphum maidis]|uniref:cytosolic carboxypeptidase 1-like n=1 Tax=Rhopalosiphum maidis TaxID=43146 RepID=UPI000EFE1BED|nr:cytosolic carboxypeptidase 1-like [Rhopalosiphum maidis]
MANKKKIIGRMNKKLTTNKRVNEQARVLYKQFRLNTTTTSVNRVAAKVEKIQQPINSKNSKTMVISGDDHVLDVLLDRLAPLTAHTTENLEKIRRIAHKINGRVNNSDKNVKAKSLNILRKTRSERMVDIVKLFEKTRDKSTCTNLAAVIHACIAPKSGQTRKTFLKQLVELEATKIFIKSIMELQSKSVGSPDVLLNELVFILGQLSQKDSKFSKHAEMLNATKMFHQNLKNNIKNIKFISPLLKCFRTITKNETIVGALLKDSFLLTLEKLLRENHKYLIKNKQYVILVILANITKKVTEENCDKVIRAGLMQYALDVFNIKLYTANKAHPKIFSSALDVLVHISNTNNGRTALRKSNKFNVLYQFSVRCPEDQVYNSAMSKLCTVINVCQEKLLLLPLSSTQSALNFSLGDITLNDNDSDKYAGCDSDDSDIDDIEIAVVQNLTDPLIIRKPESVKFEIPFNYWKDRDDLILTYGRLFAEFNNETQKHNSANKLKLNKYLNKITPLLIDHHLNMDKNEIGLMANLRTCQTHKAAYLSIAKRVNSVSPFVKVAYPDWIGFINDDQPLESLYNSDVHVSRNKLLSCLERSVAKRRDSGDMIVYDLDYLLESVNDACNSPQQISNYDERNLGVKSGFDYLNFESRFECGNLRKAIKIGPNEYDLILNSDVNSMSHSQWFYFQVSNMEALKPYVFNIVNMEKHSSQYKSGMQPIMFSVKNYTESKKGWTRTGMDICYYRNCYKNCNKTHGSYMTATFSIQFPYDQDICYIAYVYPYTYSKLLYKCFKWKNSVDPNTTLFRANCLCRSLNNNEVPIITITSIETTEKKIKDRHIIYLTSRVHPGETSSSWVIDGVIDYLCGNTITAKKARDTYVFKIVPMLNIEGVINGCHRCGLTNEDLNRKWSSPDPKLHPEIFHARGILEYMAHVIKKVPYVYCDFHGHSNTKNCFFYGCSAKKSWSRMDLSKYENETDFMVLPIVMQNCCPSFSLSQCSYKVERNRETTARITVWRSYGVKRSYTLETSYCGCDEGQYKGFHFGIKQLKEIGSTFCMSLSSLEEETKKRANLPASNRLSTITPSSSSKSMDFVDEEQSDSD